MKKPNLRESKNAKKRIKKHNLEVQAEELDLWVQVKEVHLPEALQAERDWMTIQIRSPI